MSSPGSGATRHCRSPCSTWPSVAAAQRKKPDELASIVQDLTTLLENITPMLERGRYPEKTAGKKIAGLLRAVADQLDV